MVIRWKKNLAKFENEQYKTGLASGEFLLVHGYSGDILQVQAENEDIAFAVPREGMSISCDDLVIPKDAQSVDLAHALHQLPARPRGRRREHEVHPVPLPEQAPATPLLRAGDPRRTRRSSSSPAIRAKCEVIRDLGADNAKYTKIWDEIKAAK